MKKNSIFKILTVFVFVCASVLGAACKDEEKSGPNKDFVIAHLEQKYESLLKCTGRVLDEK